MRTIRDLHGMMGVETVAVFGADGKRSERAFLVNGVHAAIVGRWRALLALLFGRTSGIRIVERGKARDGGPLAPVVVLDWETYSRMLLGLQRRELPSIGMGGDPRELAASEAKESREMGGW